MFDHFNQIRYIIRETIERIDARKSRDMGFFPLKKFQISCLSSKLNVSKEQVWVRWGISYQPPKNTDCDATTRQRGGKLPKWSIRGKLPLFQLKYGMRQFWESLQCKGDRAGSDNNFVVQKGLILRKKQLKVPIKWSCWPLTPNPHFSRWPVIMLKSGQFVP